MREAVSASHRGECRVDEELTHVKICSFDALASFKYQKGFPMLVKSLVFFFIAFIFMALWNNHNMSIPKHCRSFNISIGIKLFCSCSLNNVLCCTYNTGADPENFSREGPTLTYNCGSAQR